MCRIERIGKDWKNDSQNLPLISCTRFKENYKIIYICSKKKKNTKYLLYELVERQAYVTIMIFHSQLNSH